ncbi:MAG: hypothetical protein LBD70_01945 [Bifidobacteriaceae bacterium]|jgi:tetratricopeptide (TPR) repeat protein|nr:hypothetical protein [Bifidobacteriaceae bacterium]
MASISLRSAFLGGIKAGVTTEEVFTDRVDEQTAFLAAAQAMRADLSANAACVDDPTRPRRNVLVYYGVGGIGKSALSQRLENILWKEVPEGAKGRRVAVRIDFDDEGAADIEAVLWRIRSALGSLGPVWKAFDLAFAWYWSESHPGEPINEFLDRSPLVRGLARQFDLGGQFVDSLSWAADVSFGGFAGLAQKGILQGVRAVKDRVAKRQILADCALFESIITASADYDTLSYFPYLLAWDLNNRIKKDLANPPEVVIFLDTFEQVTGKLSVSFQNYLQRLVYLMPNVLFVVTGRNRLDWAERADGAELDYAGQRSWPLLHHSNSTVEPRQHLVGYLSDVDAESYLRTALTRDGEPAIAEPIRHRIVEGARGLPLYLDLSVSHFVTLVGHGVEPGLDDFGGLLVAVASRVMRDLSHQERELARAASLFDRYNAQVLSLAVPAASLGVIGRFLVRPFQTAVAGSTLDHCLHSCMREAIVEGDGQLPDGWTDLDRARALDRVFDGLGRLATAQKDTAALGEIMQMGLKIAFQRGTSATWLTSAALSLVNSGAIGRLAPIISYQAETGELSSLQNLVRGILLRRAGKPTEALVALDQAEVAGGSELLTAAIRVHRAHVLRNLGHYKQAVAIYSGQTGGPMAREATLWLGDYKYLNGRFNEALDAARQCGGEDGLGREAARLQAHVMRVNAMFEQARRAYQDLVERSEVAGDLPAQAKALTGLAQTVCWIDPWQVDQICSQAEEILSLVPNSVENVKLTQARAIAAVIVDAEGSSPLVEKVKAAALAVEYKGGLNLYDLAVCLRSARMGEVAEFEKAATSLQARTAEQGGNTYWAPIVRSWVEDPDRSASPRPANAPDWLGDGAAVASRWRDVALNGTQEHFV